eukprot:gb/GFBE01076779.1/.p1 GENE.gb/GFBE01076779.1/~~gb/GFBE01076779.1/.p1  ORF type:complete len:375 (+),score=35.42 gb/GFBE01076779.1/:1-1125(+)
MRLNRFTSRAGSALVFLVVLLAFQQSRQCHFVFWRSCPDRFRSRQLKHAATMSCQPDWALRAASRRTRRTAFDSPRELLETDKPEKEMAIRDPLLRLASSLLPEKQRDAIWAIYDWCRRADEVCDGEVPPRSTEERLAILRGYAKEVSQLRDGARPSEAIGEALQRTFTQWPSLGGQPFIDMISGMETELTQPRFLNFEPELRKYAYCVAGTVGLMVLPILGAPDASAEVKDRAIKLGIAIQLVNILRDVGEDARRGRIYLPLEDLHRFQVSEDDILKGQLTVNYQSLIRFQVNRTRTFLNEARGGVVSLPAQSQFAVLAVIRLMGAILDELLVRDCDSFTRKVRISTRSKLSCAVGTVLDWASLRLGKADGYD